MKNEKYYTTLSREISYALRHAPWEYELELDSEGWVPADQLIDALHHSKHWQELELSDLPIMIEQSIKKRHELNGNYIRALYGHSVPMKIVKEPAVPPKILYHGTSPDFLEAILSNGLLPMSRQYVHLSEDLETAELVGKRKHNQPVILLIDTEKAVAAGTNFYLGNEKVWLSNQIPEKFITIIKS